MKKNGEFSYDGEVGRWWLKHSLDAAHRRAYRNIADFIRDSFTREPGTIVDYACGPGDLLSLLSMQFNKSKLAGLDGSEFMLSLALRRFASLPPECAARISLVKTSLPNMNILHGEADLVTFCFPNMVPSGEKHPSRNRSCLNESDRQVARSLSLAVEEGEGAKANQCGLEQGRCISFNLRQLLSKGGICIRIEYATMRRHELSPLELAHVAFEEGSLDEKVEGILPRQWFRFSASAYFRSRVLEDVYEQSGDERDRNGGYLITVLRAI